MQSEYDMHTTDADRQLVCTVKLLSEGVQTNHATHTFVILSITSLKRNWRGESVENMKKGNTLTTYNAWCVCIP